MSSILHAPSLEHLQLLWSEYLKYTPLEYAAAAGGSLFAYAAYKLFNLYILLPYRSPIRNLQGPEDSGNVVFGHMGRIFKAPQGILHEEWAAQYGLTFQYRGFFRQRRLYIGDTRAMAHVLNHANDYPKPESMRRGLTAILGDGILVAEGEDHRRQRKIMNPCFGIAQIRDLMPIFYSKSFELRDLWLNEVSENPRSEATIDVLIWLSRMTLDAIGLAGFNYEFNTMTDGETNELAQALQVLFHPSNSAIPFLLSQIPILRHIPTSRKRIEKHSRAIMDRVGRQLVRDKKAAILQEKGGMNGKGDKGAVGKDLLTVLVQSNMATDLQESQRMSEEEIMAQITTMLLAGHETTSSTTTFLLYELAKPINKPIQDRLRAELATLSSEEPSMEELNSLPYLDAVIKENMRLNPVVSGMGREAGRDEVIPTSQPVVDRDGVEHEGVRVSKGTAVFISIIAINRDKSIWGEDAMDFNPDRWLIPQSHPRAAEIPGVFANIMTFIGGPRHCIGYRFAVLEMKVLVYTLIRNIVFSLPDPVPEVEKRSGVVTRPMIKHADGTEKSYMPLVMRAVGSD